MGEFINFVETEGICNNMHHWLGKDPLDKGKVKFGRLSDPNRNFSPRHKRLSIINGPFVIVQTRWRKLGSRFLLHLHSAGHTANSAIRSRPTLTVGLHCKLEDETARERTRPHMPRLGK